VGEDVGSVVKGTTDGLEVTLGASEGGSSSLGDVVGTFVGLCVVGD